MQKARVKHETEPDKIWGDSLEGIAYDGTIDAFDVWPQPVVLGPVKA